MIFDTWNRNEVNRYLITNLFVFYFSIDILKLKRKKETDESRNENLMKNKILIKVFFSQ